ncbi:MAG: Pathogenesis-related transcriptional factor and ERF protein [Candidatus Cyclobacteriaceae bacterium M3_2C_046]
MLYKLKLKNSREMALVDDVAYEYISSNEYLKSIEFVNNLRIHSSGYAFFQKTRMTKVGKYKTETIYLHKLIAEKFVPKPESEKKLYALIRNGKRLDCRIKNLEWAPLSKVTRNTKYNDSKLGYRGVHKARNKFQAVIYNNCERIDLGYFDTPEEAAEAYNKKSIELFGETIGLNKNLPEVKKNEIQDKVDKVG